MWHKLNVDETLSLLSTANKFQVKKNVTDKMQDLGVLRVKTVNATHIFLL